MPRRAIVAILAALVAAAFCLPAHAQTDTADPLSTRDLNALKREIQQKERQLKTFESALRKLKAAARQTSNSAARSAAERTESVMREVIRYEEQKLGEDSLIKQHGQDVATVPTNELTEGNAVRTRNRRRYELPPDTPPEYIRLVRLQDIYATCQTLKEHAIARSGEAPERYGNLTREFADLMREDLAALQAKLPEDTEPGLYYPLKTDSTAAKPDTP